MLLLLVCAGLYARSQAVSQGAERVFVFRYYKTIYSTIKYYTVPYIQYSTSFSVTAFLLRRTRGKGVVLLFWMDGKSAGRGKGRCQKEKWAIRPLKGLGSDDANLVSLLASAEGCAKRGAVIGRRRGSTRLLQNYSPPLTESLIMNDMIHTPYILRTGPTTS